ncbi:hypothetical protein KYJ26_00310 [Bacillus sp. MCCB 382]|uniref:hypothetical protein n=1 Tax=Bacillus sp. MCCB 382 TaxID=2860197 RepID=UPI001C565002|nr:hypothetical protein [Bacillus sp. MCCB 382]
MGIEEYLYYGEYVIFEGKAPEVMIENGSSFGVYSLVMTNQGRIIAHDTGGFFSEEKVYYFPRTKKICVKLEDEKVHLVGKTMNFKFDFSLDLQTYFEVVEQFGTSHFELDPNQNQHCFLFADLNESNIYSAEFLIKDHEICFKIINSDRPLEFMTLDIAEIAHISEEENHIIRVNINLEFMGVYQDSIYLFVPDERQRLEFLSIMNDRETIYNIAYDEERITAAFIKCQLNDSRNIAYDVYILDDDTSFRIVLRNHLKVLLTKEKKDVEEYFNKDSKETVLKIGENYFYIQPKQNVKEQFTLKVHEDNEFYYFENTGYIKGLLEGIEMKEQVDTAISENSIHLINHITKLSITTIMVDTVTFINDGNLLLVTNHENLACLELDSSKLHVISFINVKEFENEKILFDIFKEPFYYEQNDEGLVLYRDNREEPIHTLRNRDMMNLKLKLERIGNSFGLLSSNEVENSWGLYLPVNSFKEIVYKAFTFIKVPVLVDTNPKSLYGTMVREVSDLLLYEYFGQLMVLDDGIEEFYEVNMSEKDRTSRLVSYLYYGIQAQRKRMDSISVYMPGVLNKVEQELFMAYGKHLGEKYFKDLQKHLIGITNQMKGSLLEIENNLMQCGVLISKRSTKEMVNERRKSGYKSAGLQALMGVGITVLTGGAAAPLLLAPTFMALNTNNSANMMKLQEEIKEENEQNRTDFYFRKALDLFDHYIQTMMPYYVSKVNDAIVDCYKKLAFAYEPILEEPLLKEKLLQRIAEIFTYKKLPVDSTTEVAKQEILNGLFTTIEESQLSINAFEQILKISNELPTLENSK